jgi:hypothetical protein
MTHTAACRLRTGVGGENYFYFDKLNYIFILSLIFLRIIIFSPNGDK